MILTKLVRVFSNFKLPEYTTHRVRSLRIVIMSLAFGKPIARRAKEIKPAEEVYCFVVYRKSPYAMMLGQKFVTKIITFVS